MNDIAIGIILIVIGAFLMSGVISKLIEIKRRNNENNSQK